MDLIIKNGTVVTATDTYLADIGVAGGRIVHIGQALASDESARVVDASGRYVFPGAIDVHTHLDSPGQGTVTADDFLTGTIAAACGGTTTIVDFCTQERGQSLVTALAEWHAKAEGKAVVDYGFHCVVVDLSDAVFRELPRLPEMGVTSFKLFMAYRGGFMIDDWTLIHALEQAKSSGAMVMVHAENGDAAEFLRQKLLSEGKTDPKYHATSRPPRVEAEATARAIALAEIVGAPIYIVHLSCAEALEEVVRGKARGVKVYAETCPQYLYLTEDDLARPGFEGAKYVFTPPARSRFHQQVLWRALANGELSIIASDHAPYNYKGQKDRGLGDFTQIPNGGPGIETRVMLSYQGVREGYLTLNRFVEVVATAPAKMFGLYPQKGTIAIGSDADLIVWNPEAELVLGKSALHENLDYTSYEGLRIRGIPEVVTLRGEVIVRDREYVGRSGGGRFIARNRFVA